MRTSERATSELTKTELAQVLDVTEALIDQWVRDGVIPPHYYSRGEDRAYRFAPIAVALGEVMVELQDFFGVTSPRPKQVIRQMLPKLELAWQQPGVVVHFCISSEYAPLELRGTTAAFDTARRKLAAFATA